MPNFKRILAGSLARALGRLLDGQSPGDVTWLARTLYADRDRGPAVALSGFAQAYYEIFRCNCSGDIAANGEIGLLRRLSAVPMKVALDVGANVGSWTVAMKSCSPDIEVHAFEIIPETAREMRGNVAGLTGVHLNEYGLSDETAEIEMWHSASNNVLTSSVGARRDEFPELADTWRSVRGQVLRGDDFLTKHQIDYIDFLKIDVEGMEMKVLTGLERAFARNAIGMVQFEYGPLNKFIPLLLRDLYGFFEARGFVVGKVYPKGVAFKRYETRDEDFLGLTYLAAHAERKDLIERIRYQ